MLPPSALETLPALAAARTVAAAEMLRGGRWEVLGVERDDLGDPDWFKDPVSGRRAPDTTSAFRVDYRSVDQCGNVKQVWELSRHHHLTVLAAAWRISGDDAYADMVDRHLRSWWRQNPFLSGVHWTSGIELGIRLISWVWVRRLLDGWSGAAGLFEQNDDALRQIHWHQRYLAAFRSRGSSANNHVVAEAAGQLVASCAFPWFPESLRWRSKAAHLLELELRKNTFPDGVDRELSFGYHRLVAELGLLAAVEADLAGAALTDATWHRLAAMFDAFAALCDAAGRPPSGNDADDATALMLDPTAADRPTSLLALGSAVIRPMPWWPPSQPDTTSTMVAALSAPVGTDRLGGRPSRRPSHFPDAGLTVLRWTSPGDEELWCCCDGGPLGYLSIAAHGHADALAVEVRHGGVDVFCDAGTFCYHDEPAWRAYFRSTAAHNTIELAGRDQSLSGGPFLWVRPARTSVLDVAAGPPQLPAGVQRWSAEHDGYGSLRPPAVHRRTVTLNGPDRCLEILDTVLSDGSHPVRMTYLLGPTVCAEVDGATARLSWPGAASETVRALVSLPPGLEWTSLTGSMAPLAGWYSPSFGRRAPTTVLVGTGRTGPAAGAAATTWRTEVRFDSRPGTLSPAVQHGRRRGADGAGDPEPSAHDALAILTESSSSPHPG